MSDDNEYVKYGANQPGSIGELDPVACAINDPVTGNSTSMFTCAGNPLRTKLGLATSFMAQRCSNQWDGYCTLYLQQELKADYTQKKAQQFIRELLMNMFCVSANVEGSECYTRCEMYNPTSSSSFSICQDRGDVVFRTSEQLEANSTDFNQSGKLNTAQPIRIASCPKVCDKITADKLTDDNVALNIALDNGIAMDLIQNLLQNIISAKKQSLVTNSRLLNFMKVYVETGSLSPGLYTLGKGPNMSERPIAVPSVNPYIPPQTTFLVKEDTGITGNTPVAPKWVTEPGQEIQVPSPVPSPVPSKEGYAVHNTGAKSVSKLPFAFLDLSNGNSTDSKLLIAILVISALAIVSLLIAKRK